MAGGISPQLGVYWLLFSDPPTFTESLFFLSTHSEPHTQGMGTDLGPESLGGTCARGIEQQDEEPHSGAVSGKPLLKKSMHAKSCKSCPALCDPEDSSPPGSSVQAILQARLLEWVVVPSSRGSSPPRDQSWVFCIGGRFFTILPQMDPHPPWSQQGQHRLRLPTR